MMRAEPGESSVGGGSSERRTTIGLSSISPERIVKLEAA